MRNRPIYMDYQASTPVDPHVMEVMMPYFNEGFGNPHSIHHEFGYAAAQAVAYARQQVANFIGAGDDEIIFVSGATESCNLALRGLSASSSESRQEIVTLCSEHPAVLETARALSSQGLIVNEVPVASDGIVDLHLLEQIITERTLVVSVMLANNEIGVIQPVSEIASIAHSQGAFMHTDATQAAGRIELDVDELDCDLLSISSHKIYGPMGVGALYVRNSCLPKLTPLLSGGGQEGGLRSGTVPLPLVVGFGEACDIAFENLSEDSERLATLSQKLYSSLASRFPAITLNGHPSLRIPGSLNFSLPSISGDEIVTILRNEVAFSTGSACSSSETTPSHVLVALGQSHRDALRAFRLSLGRPTTLEEVECTYNAFDSKLSHIKGVA